MGGAAKPALQTVMDELERNKISDLSQAGRWKDLEYKLKVMNIWKEQTEKCGIRLLMTEQRRGWGRGATRTAERHAIGFA